MSGPHAFLADIIWEQPSMENLENIGFHLYFEKNVNGWADGNGHGIETTETDTVLII